MGSSTQFWRILSDLSNSVGIFITAKTLHILQWLFKYPEKRGRKQYYKVLTTTCNVIPLPSQYHCWIYYWKERSEFELASSKNVSNVNTK